MIATPHATNKVSFYDLLDEYRGLSHSSLLEESAVRQLFYWQAASYSKESLEDLRQQAYIMFLRMPQIDPPETAKFSRYLAVVVRHIVLKAYRWRNTKRRKLPTLGLQWENGTIVEPNGEHAAVLFDRSELAQIHATLFASIKDETSRKRIADVLEGILDGDTMQATADRLGLKLSQVGGSKHRIKRILTRKVVKS